MLDFGFSEIVLTSAIALVVLGPERLPKVARQVGNWMGRARAMARQLSEQLEREVSADELLREQTKVKPPMMNRIAQPYIPPPEPQATPDPRTALPDLHAVSPDNPDHPLPVHESVAAVAAAHEPPSEMAPVPPVGVTAGVPDLHAVAPEEPQPHHSAPAPVESRNPPNE